jgi:hypothetical protein
MSMNIVNEEAAVSDKPLQRLKTYEVDGQLLRTGSENFSHAAPAQDNDLIVIHDPSAAAKFEAHFTAM